MIRLMTNDTDIYSGQVTSVQIIGNDFLITLDECPSSSEVAQSTGGSTVSIKTTAKKMYFALSVAKKATLRTYRIGAELHLLSVKDVDDKKVLEAQEQIDGVMRVFKQTIGVKNND